MKEAVGAAGDIAEKVKNINEMALEEEENKT